MAYFLSLPTIVKSPWDPDVGTGLGAWLETPSDLDATRVLQTSQISVNHHLEKLFPGFAPSGSLQIPVKWRFCSWRNSCNFLPLMGGLRR
jgi:hypothetical protein